MSPDTIAKNAPPNVDISVEGDLTIVRMSGEYSREVADYVFDTAESVSTQYGYRLALYEIRGPVNMNAATRKYMMEKLREHRKLKGSSAVVGANFATLTLSQMVIRAVRAIIGTELGVNFFATEAEARRWLDQERIRLQTQATH